MDLLLGAALRTAFLHTTLHASGGGAVPTTDVDHAVALRGAAAAAAGTTSSPLNLCAPFADPSFRYPPTVAILAAPALFFHPGAAKALYCACDLAIAALTPPLGDASALARLAWALNPVSSALAARGSSDSATAVLVLLTVRRVKQARVLAEGGRRRRSALAAAAAGGAALGAASYHRLVPAMHALPLGAHLAHTKSAGSAGLVVAFLAGAALTGAAATATTLAACGRPYWRAAIAHHATRVDARHSFAPAFLSAHLGGRWGDATRRLSLPCQAAVVVAAGLALGPATPATAAALQALGLVSLNRVVTAQYWLWFGALLPTSAVELARRWGGGGQKAASRRRRLGSALAAWVLSQAAWLVAAHRLEVRGGGVWGAHVVTWVAALAAHASNVWLFLGVAGVADGAGRRCC
jgi:phosphatidylinositol glycan class M